MINYSTYSPVPDNRLPKPNQARHRNRSRRSCRRHSGQSGRKGRTAAIIAGTLAGAYIGGSIGQEMDDNDHYHSQQALESNMVNRTTSWRNPDSGNSYEVTPTRTFNSDNGPCREYTTEAVINGRAETVYGTACGQPDGTWQASNYKPKQQ